MARWVSRRIALACAALALGAAGLASAQASLRVVLRFENEALVLAIGAVVASQAPDGGEQLGDVRIAYNAERPVHAVVVAAREGIAIAHLAGTPFSAVDAATAGGADFSAGDSDHPFASGDTVLVRTPEGGLFKLGNAGEDEAAVAFDCEPLQ